MGKKKKKKSVQLCVLAPSSLSVLALSPARRDLLNTTLGITHDDGKHNV